jgi:DNA repair exonuclease SbcCD ATPase subunit
MVKVYWPLNRNGVRQPSRQERRTDEDSPSGPQVLPGTYKVVAVWGKLKDSTSVTVKSDPRLEVKMDDLKAKDAAYRDFEKVIKKASEGFDQLKEARNTIRRVDAALANAPDSTKQQLGKLSKVLQDSLNVLERLYTEPEDVKGIQRDDDNLTSALGRAQQYINASEGAPNQGAQRMLAQARKQTAEVLARINNFFSTKFADYRKKVEAVQFSLFKPYTPLKVE